MIYTIENKRIKASISSLGATLVSFIDKETNTDIVLGYDNESDYLKDIGPHVGATVGRNANRIGGGQFEIDGIKYQVSKNDGPNNLHSGISDLSFRAYKVLEHSPISITFVLTDYDMTGGFPGNLEVQINYSLNDNSLIQTFSGISDKKTIFNFTNHSYFNLFGGSKDVLTHELKINTDKVSLNDSNGMSTAEVMDVKKTSFDFRTYKRINANLKLKSKNLAKGGLDHNFVFETLEPKEMARLRNSKLELVVSSDYPDLHVYSACFLGDKIGKGGQEYHDFYGLCLECDYYPNGINYEGFLKPIIEANTKVSHFIKYTINKR